MSSQSSYFHLISGLASHSWVTRYLREPRVFPRRRLNGEKRRHKKHCMRGWAFFGTVFERFPTVWLNWFHLMWNWREIKVSESLADPSEIKLGFYEELNIKTERKKLRKQSLALLHVSGTIRHLKIPGRTRRLLCTLKFMKAPTSKWAVTKWEL